MPEAFICDAVRTPIGRYAGALAKVRTDDLAAIPLRALMARNPKIDWSKLDPFGKIPEFKFCAAKVERVEPVREAAE